MRSLSGRFLILTILFVMLAEVLIFVPSIARYRQDYLLQRLERAQIATLTLLGSEQMITPDVEAELLENAGVLNVVLRRDALRELMLSSTLPGAVGFTVDLSAPSIYVLIRDALRRLSVATPEVIRVIGVPVKSGGIEIEITMDSRLLRASMLEYALNILILSLIISIITAALLFVSVRRLLVRPIQMLVDDMDRFAASPEDARQIIQPTSKVRELRAAEEALYAMERQVSQSLKQKQRLVQLGEAVAKIAHDLRNILTTATLLGDRLHRVEDATVQRVAPRLIASLGRAVALTEGTLAFGRAEEAPPQLKRTRLQEVCEEVCESERLAVKDDAIEIICDVAPDLAFPLDKDQMYRVLTNLVRNACQAILATKHPGHVCISAYETTHTVNIEVHDTGPGLPEKARENLFKPFGGSARKGGTGLGLIISTELVRGHGGTLTLKSSDDTGTVFLIELPLKYEITPA